MLAHCRSGLRYTVALYRVSTAEHESAAIEVKEPSIRADQFRVHGQPEP